MVNPDNFIFHSDFRYPTGYLSGTKEYTNVSIPANFELSDKYTDGDYYSIFIEYSSAIAERFRSDTIIPYTVGNKLIAYKGAQSQGSTFTAKLHWRIYPKSSSFNFLSTGRLEQTAKTLDGFFTAPGDVNSFLVEIPSGLTGKYFPRGTWQIEGSGANIIGGQASSGDFTPSYDFVNNKVSGYISTFPGVVAAGTKIYYKIQLVPIVSQDIFVFNSQKYSFALPKIVSPSITTTGTMAPNTTNTLYGDWVDIPGSKTAFDLIVKWNGEPNNSYLHYREMTFVSGSMSGTANLESDGKRVRPVLLLRNYSGNSVSYPTQIVTYGIYFYQNNNTT